MKLTCKNISELPKLAEQVIAATKNHKIILFNGEMGAGKTTLITEICKQLGVTDEISSPTFSIVNEYLGANNQTIYHFDFYRIESEEEAYDFGYEDYLYSGDYCFIEWSEKIENLLPKNSLSLLIEQNQGVRTVTINL